MPGGTLAQQRLVVVSNRIPTPRGEGTTPAGGLVSALQPALEEMGGLWFGWSGKQGGAEAGARRIIDSGVEYAAIDLSAAEIAGYYEGFSNQTLWPVLHGLRHRADMDPSQYAMWRSVNRRFAAALAPLVHRDDLVFVQDYHLIPLGEELRRMGWTGALGYFHHVPIPPSRAWEQLPHARTIAALFGAYDLVGLQTPRDAEHLSHILGPGATCRVGAYPIGIDTERLRAMRDTHPEDAFGRPRGAGGERRKVLFGVDRLDYTKGIPWRLQAYERLLQREARLAATTAFVQWAAPSRSAIPEYQRERSAIEAVVERINQLHAQAAPVRFAFAPHPPDRVAAALRDADVCVVTSLADGMNLVAKEFVAAQHEADPGVLILSDTCGAAAELQDALIVQATNVASIEQAMMRALSMPLEERRARWRALSHAVESNTAHHWLRSLLLDLLAAREAQRMPVAEAWPTVGPVVRQTHAVIHADDDGVEDETEAAGIGKRSSAGR